MERVVSRRLKVGSWFEFYLLLPGGKACTFYIFTRKPRTSVHRSLTPLLVLAGHKWDPDPRLRLHLTLHLMRQLECIQLSRVKQLKPQETPTRCLEYKHSGRPDPDAKCL